MFDLMILPDGKSLVTASNTIDLRHATTGNLVRRPGWHKDRVTSLVISPEGTTLFSNGADRTIRRWTIRV